MRYFFVFVHAVCHICLYIDSFKGEIQIVRAPSPQSTQLKMSEKKEELVQEQEEEVVFGGTQV